MATITELHHPQGALVSGLNIHGDACGSGGSQGLIWREGASDPTSAFDDVILLDINNARIAVGIQSPANDPNKRAIQVGSPGAVPILVIGPGNEYFGARSEATCISSPMNGNGAIGGHMFFWQGPATIATGFTFDLGNAQFIPSLKPQGVHSLGIIDINANGDFCGIGDDGHGYLGRAFQNGLFVVWAPLANANDLEGLNSAHSVVGTSWNAATEDFAPAMWVGPAIQQNAHYPPVQPQLIALPPPYTGGRACGINDGGSIVGTCWPYDPNADRTVFSPDQLAFAAYPGGYGQPPQFYLLNDLFNGPANGWNFQWALRVNIAEQIVGWGTLNGVSTSFLITP